MSLKTHTLFPFPFVVVNIFILLFLLMLLHWSSGPILIQNYLHKNDIREISKMVYKVRYKREINVRGGINHMNLQHQSSLLWPLTWPVRHWPLPRSWQPLPGTAPPPSPGQCFRLQRTVPAAPEVLCGSAQPLTHRISSAAPANPWPLVPSARLRVC